ncbi:MAG TPA: hypothetical protein VM163_05440 [bacterium]|nr:hypothetical protein [bacterium]
MTTIACDRESIACDTRAGYTEVNDDTFVSLKLYPAKSVGALYGLSGENCAGAIMALEWLQSERNPELKPRPPDYDHDWDWKLLELSRRGIAVYNEYLERDPIIERVAAIGSGAKVALYCMKILGMSPAEAVREACKVDHHSELPIYVVSLNTMRVARYRLKASNKAPKLAKLQNEDRP